MHFSPMYLSSIVFRFMLLITSSFANQRIQLYPLGGDTLQHINDLKDLPPIHQFRNVEDLQQNMHQFLNKINYTNNPRPIVIHLTDSNSLVFPDDVVFKEQIKHTEQPPFKPQNYVSSPSPPEDWIELYGSDIIQQSSTQAIEIQTLSTVLDDSARGEVAYSTGRLKKVSSEYDSKMSLYLGFIAFIGITSGLTFAPEFEFSTSFSIYYTCPVLAGETVVVKVYPTLTTFTPYTKKLKWDHKLLKFATKLPFSKLQKVSLFALTGLEDVECFYI